MKLFGVIGNPISHSLSPIMHEAAFKALGKSCAYLPMLVEPNQLDAALKGAAALGFTGLNVTIPFKEQVIPYLTELTDGARAIGSVNTILFKDNQIIGHSTDGLGFQWAAKEELGLEFSNRRVLVIGAGGAARAIISQLLKLNCIVYVANRTFAKIERVIRDIAQNRANQIVPLELSTNKLAQVMHQISVVINTTSVGMQETKGQTPISADLLHSNQAVIDIIYNPKESLLLRLAKEKGCPTQNGVGMLVWQAAKSWEFWLGITPPIDVMYAAVKASLP